MKLVLRIWILSLALGLAVLPPNSAFAARFIRGQTIISNLPTTGNSKRPHLALRSMNTLRFTALATDRLSDIAAKVSVRRKLRISAPQISEPFSSARNPCNTPPIRRLLRVSKGLRCDPDWEGQLTAVPNDTLLSSMYSASTSAAGNINVRDAWDLSTGSSSTVVGIIDTGIDYNHLDLAPNIWTNPLEIAANGIDDDGDGLIDDVHGYDFLNSDSDPMDDHSHGTAVSGVIGAVGNNARGIVGINWNIKLVACKAFNASGTGSLSAVVNCLNYMVELKRDFGVNIVATNNSYGGFPNTGVFYDAIAATRDQNMVFVTAAGNSARNNDNIPTYPASFGLDNIIVAAATDSAANITNFSNYGADSVDIAAPGIGVLTTILNNQYGYYEGTSIAGPHLAGAIALILSYHPEYVYSQAIDSILNTGTFVPGLAGLCRTSAILNVAQALQFAAPTPTATPSPIPTMTPTPSGPNLETAELSISATNSKSKSVARCTLRAQNGSAYAGLSGYQVTLTIKGSSLRARARTNSDGRVSFTLRPRRGIRYRARCSTSVTIPNTEQAKTLQSNYATLRLT